MSLQGLPDFRSPLGTGALQVFYTYEGTGSHVIFPSALEVAPDDQGRPDFRLELVRGASPLLPPKPYGVLSLGLGPKYPMDEALALVRAEHQEALISTVWPPIFSGGFLRL